MKKSTKNLINIGLLIVMFVALYFIEKVAGTRSMLITVLKKGAIYALIAVSMNLLNGFTGLFSLGQAGFMLVGAYTYAVLTIPMAKRMAVYQYYDGGVINFTVPAIVGILAAGALAAILAALIGLPVLRLRGDYLAIATMGFSEIIRVLITNMQGVTNGAQGLKSIPGNANIWWCYGVALLVIVFIALLTSSSYGTALKAIREDQIAAESMGVSLYFHKMLAFMLSAFIAAVGGGLLASYNGTIGPDMFRVAQTYNVLMIVVMGGMGSITGSIAGAFIVTIGQEYLRVLDGPINLGFWSTDGISGMRMVVFSAILLLIIVFFRNGLFGTKELSWSAIGRRLRRMSGHGEVKG